MKALSPFRQSRVYAEVWNAARALAGSDPVAAARLNPYRTEPEQSRWAEGFGAGLS